MRGNPVVIAAAAVILSCGCIMLADEAEGVWEKEPFSTHEKMTVRPDGTFVVSDQSGNTVDSGRWERTNGGYEFIFENGSGAEKLNAEIYPGRAHLFLIIGNTTYSKI